MWIRGYIWSFDFRFLTVMCSLSTHSFYHRCDRLWASWWFIDFWPKIRRLQRIMCIAGWPYLWRLRHWPHCKLIRGYFWKLMSIQDYLDVARCLSSLRNKLPMVIFMETCLRLELTLNCLWLSVWFIWKSAYQGNYYGSYRILGFVLHDTNLVCCFTWYWRWILDRMDSPTIFYLAWNLS